jgi:hypothetical protein
MAVTHLGAHMAPVTFYRDSQQPIQPYYISPWQGENLVLDVGRSEIPLRGDFFCLPFGVDRDPSKGEKHLPHGETSGSLWSLIGVEEGDGVQTLTIGMETKAREGYVTRAFSLVELNNVIYDCTTIHGFAGPVTLAHHAVLRSPEQERSLLLSTSSMKVGMVYPFPLGVAAAGDYQSLKIGAEFSTLERVPSIFKHMGDQDCSSYPARRGFCDLLQLANVPDDTIPAWTAAVNTVEGYLWFALKDARVLPSTIVWMENHGRHGVPWSGRNCALGLEDACTFFDRGIPESSRANAFSDRGIRTHHVLGADAFEVRYIQGAVKCPPGFGRVFDAVFSAGAVTFVDFAGKSISTAVQSGFLRGDILR